MTWIEFKNFLRKNLGDSRAFVNSIWKKVKRDSQYQDKLVQDWAAHLEYLQSILIEFDSECAPEEGTMIWYFQKGLRPSVRVKMEQCGQELNSFEELVEKAVDAKAKAAFRPYSHARETDQHCVQGSQPSTAKTSTQGQPMKDLRVEEPKSKPQESKAPAPQRSTDNGKTSKQAWKEKKKKEKRERRNREREPQNSTPTTRANSTSTGKEKSKRNGSNRRDPSQITCWNCSKKGYYADKYPKPPKPKK